MSELKIMLPHSRWDYHVIGVYRIQFETGEFYIGGSKHLHSRASSWASIFESPDKGLKQYAIGNAIINRIKKGGVANFEIVELCGLDDLRERELEYLDKYKDDPLMLSDGNCSWKAVLQYKEDGVFIKKHMSIQSAAKYVGTYMGRIQDVLNGVRKTHKGMVFIYESEHASRRKEIIKARSSLKPPKKNKSLQVGQYDNDLNLLNTFVTYAEAGRYIAGDPKNIRRVIAGQQKTAYGFYWKLVQA